MPRGRTKKVKPDKNYYMAIIAPVARMFDRFLIPVRTKLANDLSFSSYEILHRKRKHQWVSNSYQWVWSDDEKEIHIAWFMAYEADTLVEMTTRMTEIVQDLKYVNAYVYDLVNKKLVYKRPYSRGEFNQKTMLYGEKINIENLKKWGAM